jgi:hypothetical protein
MSWEGGLKLIRCKKGFIKEILSKYNNITELLVDIGGLQQKAINYDKLTGIVQIGDDVLLNTTAVDLSLGSGGYHFVLSINNGISSLTNVSDTGHIMKMRYTPLQFSVLSAEEEYSPYQYIFDRF